MEMMETILIVGTIMNISVVVILSIINIKESYPDIKQLSNWED